MEAAVLKEETKSLIDDLGYEEVMLVYDYAREVSERKHKYDFRDIVKYRGKLDLDIDLDALRGRNDPRYDDEIV